MRLNLRKVMSIVALMMAAIFIYSCTSEQVASSGFIQKRKYRKGFYIAHTSHVKSNKANVRENMQNVADNARKTKVPKSIKAMPQRVVVADNYNSKALKLAMHKTTTKHAEANFSLNSSSNIAANKIAVSKTPLKIHESKAKVSKINDVAGGDADSTFGIISLIAGILGIIGCFFIGGILFAILAIVFGILSHGDQLGKIGLILGIIAVALFLIVFLLIIVIIAGAAAAI